MYCEDCISRAELLKAIDTWDKFGCDANTKLVPYQDHYVPYIHYDDVVKCIKGMPSVTPKAEQKAILDKIRAEIKEERRGYPPSADEYKTINKVLQILDKYKAESGKEGE